MGSAEFSRWLVFLEEEDLGPGALRAWQAQVLAALHNGPLVKKSRDAWRASEFMPSPWRRRAAAARPAAATGRDARSFIAALRNGRGGS